VEQDALWVGGGVIPKYKDGGVPLGLSVIPPISVTIPEPLALANDEAGTVSRKNKLAYIIINFGEINFDKFFISIPF
jgi:hypothetical protein